MNAAPTTIVVVDINLAAAKVLRDPVGLSGVSRTDLVGLAQYALADETPVLSAELAAAIARVIRDRNKLDLCRLAALAPTGEVYTVALADAVEDFNEGLVALQSIFEREFPQ